MKRFSTLLVLVMALSFVIQPVMIDALFAQTYTGTSTGTGTTINRSAGSYTSTTIATTATLSVAALSSMSAEAAALYINSNVRDAATAQKAASSLSLLSAEKAVLICINPKLSPSVAAQLLSYMEPAKAASIMNNMTSSYAAVVLGYMTPVKAGGIVVFMDNTKAAGVISALTPTKAAAILFAKDPAKTEPTVNNMKILYILERMSPDRAALVINTYCAANPGTLPARVEQLFRKEVPSVTAKIFASSAMSVTTCVRILSAIKAQGFPDKVNSILAALDTVNKYKSDQIRKGIIGTWYVR